MTRVAQEVNWLLKSLVAITAILFFGATLAGSAGDYLNYVVDPEWDVTTPRGEIVNIDFSTTEATHSSVDITPDGKWVVFDLLGHIYRVPASGGETEVLTQNSGIALNFHPRISPDGEKIAFISDRKGQNNLWVMNLDGSEQEPVFLDPVTRLTSPEWAADGRAIYAVRAFPTYSIHRRSERVWRFPYRQPEQHAEEVIGKPSGFQASWPSISSDGKHLYFMHSTFPAQFTGRQLYQHIRRLNLVSGSVSSVTQAEGLDASKNEGFTELAPEVSPDGKWLAFARRIPNSMLEYRGHQLRHRTALWLLNLQTGQERIVMDPISRDLQDSHGMKKQKVLPGYGWASDSKSIVISEGGKIRRLWIGSGQVDTIAFNARVQRVASEQARAKNKLKTGPVAAQVIRWPSVTPDGKTTFFQSTGWLWRKALPNGNSERMVADDSRGMQLMPALSPDGKTLAWVSWDDHQLGHLWTVSVNGGKVREMSDRAGAYYYPMWSPDGELYVTRAVSTDPAALAGNRPTDYTLYRVQKRGKLEPVSPAGLVPMAFGPAGRLYWGSTVSVGHNETQRRLELGTKLTPEYSVLNSMLPGETAAPRQHMRFPAAEWAAPSADGKWVAYVEQGELYLTPYQRSQGRYNEDNPMTWRGRETPYTVIKEDPREKVAQVSEGGVVDPRWINANQLVYSQGGELRIYNTETGQQRRYQTNVTIGEPVHSKTLALTNARIITLKDRQVIENGTLIIAGNKIQCVGECDIGGADQVMEMTGKTLIPGFVDVHAHGFGDGSALVGNMLPAAAMYLSHGVTTALDPYVSRKYAFTVAELIHAGRLPGPRVYSTGESTMPRSPQIGPTRYRQAEAEVHRNSSLGAISTKIYLSPGRAQRQMFVEAARKYGISATNEAADLLSDVASLLDGSTGLEHAMNLMPSYGDVATFFAQIKAVYTPTLVVSTTYPWVEEYFRSRTQLWQLAKQRRFMPWAQLARSIDHSVAPLTEYSFPIYAESAKDIVRAGGYVSLGGHAQHAGLDSHWETWAFAHAMQPMEALEAASQGGARMLGMEEQIGSLEAGKLADLIILNANPLENIQNTLDIHGVLKGGILYDDDTLDERWPEAVSRPVPSWVEPEVFQDNSKSVGHWDIEQ